MRRVTLQWTDWVAGLILAGLLGSSLGMLGGIGYARRFMMAAPGDEATPAIVAQADVKPAPSSNDIDRQPSEAPTLARYDETAPPQPIERITVQQDDPISQRLDVVPPPEAMSDIEPPPKVVVPGQGRTLYACADIEHLAATSDRPGQCSRCDQPLEVALRLPHAVQAVMYFHRRASEPTTPTKVESERPSPAEPLVGHSLAQKGRVLYACRRVEHIDATTDQPGRCAECDGELMLATTLPHGLQAMRHFAAANEPVATTPADTIQTLYTCLVRGHVSVTTNRPGVCPQCSLELFPVERVAHEALARDVWSSRQPASRAAPSQRRTLPDLYTCPDVAHVDSTQRRRGRCGVCGLALRLVYDVVHQAEAIRAFVHKHDRRSASPTVATRRGLVPADR